MADKKAAAPAKGGGKAAAPQNAQQRRSSAVISLIMAVVVILAAIMPTACILIPGMLPTLCAMIGDRDKEKAATITVGAMNLVGVAQVIIKLWKEGHDFDTSFSLLVQPVNWMIMYGAAAVGWGIYFVIPGVVASFMTAGAEARIMNLRKNLEELKRIWGNEVG